MTPPFVSKTSAPSFTSSFAPALSRPLMDPGGPAPDGLTDAQGRAAPRRLAVYRNNVVHGLKQALSAGFPACHALLGAENFDRLASVYAREHPPSDPRMPLYGARFSAFLVTRPDLAHMPWLPDVARLEYSLRLSYRAADSVPIQASCLQSLPPEALGRVRFTFASALRLLRSPWPLRQIHRHALNPSTPPPRPEAEDLLITRPALDPRIDLLSPGGAACLAALMRGQPLGSAIDAGAAYRGFELEPLLTLLLSAAAITGVAISGDRP
ncbi:DNA-binding domain-containing protein [Sagittula salina]|uniref:DNA-binding domain-containing protein n=1 Tax=Sagittula salina TaxID=2820268 RepID=A0A940MND2_9RHOB|nr:DNA-binding domain-containing protein [Sagittula salina]MBP0481703.1 putative DNA-binding domain-containing protein [Sagittula salina]